MSFTGVDVGVAVLVLVSAILAAARGFTREILSLATWAGAAAIAAYIYFNGPEYLKADIDAGTVSSPAALILQLHEFARKTINEPVLASIALVVAVFLVALIILHLLTMWIGDLVVDSKVGPLDRTLGFVFGGARGVLICVIAAIFGVWLLSDPKVEEAVINQCVAGATTPAGQQSAFDQACVTYAAAPGPAARKTLLQACLVYARQPEADAEQSPAEKACVAYDASRGPMGDPGLPSWMVQAKSLGPLSNLGDVLLKLLPKDLQAQLRDFLDKSNDTGGNEGAGAQPPGGAVSTSAETASSEAATN